MGQNDVIAAKCRSLPDECDSSYMCCTTFCCMLRRPASEKQKTTTNTIKAKRKQKVPRASIYTKILEK
eukprot:4731560-Amphidinium_carterae.1